MSESLLEAHCASVRAGTFRPGPPWPLTILLHCILNAFAPVNADIACQEKYCYSSFIIVGAWTLSMVRHFKDNYHMIFR